MSGLVKQFEMMRDMMKNMSGMNMLQLLRYTTQVGNIQASGWQLRTI